MNYKINSPEFANAWRIVSEAFLEYVQLKGLEMGKMLGQAQKIFENTPLANVNDNGSVTHQTELVQPEVSKQSIPTRDFVCYKYVVGPAKQPDGTYRFKNLKPEKQDVSIYKLSKYSDDTYEFELCDLKGESLQILKDNIGNHIPDKVGSISGRITENCKILTIKKGRGVANGHSVTVVEPMIVEFKNQNNGENSEEE